MLRVQGVWAGVGGVSYTSWYFRSDDLADAGECHANVVGFLNDSRNVRVPGATCTVQPEVQRIDPITGVLDDITTEDPVTVAGNAAAQERVGDALQVLVRMRTNGFKNGRRVRGRLFLPGTASQFQAGGNFGSTGPATVTTAALNLRNAAETATAPWVVWSRPVRVDENTQIPGQIYDVADVSVWTEFAVLRSRRS